MPNDSVQFLIRGILYSSVGFGACSEFLAKKDRKEDTYKICSSVVVLYNKYLHEEFSDRIGNRCIGNPQEMSSQLVLF